MKPLLLMILDGWGHREDPRDNGIALARKPNFDRLWSTYPHTLIDGSGAAVGLSPGIMGNSEVGHMNLGAGRIVRTGLSQIYQAIAEKSFFSNPALKQAMAAGKKSALHLMGLISDGAVHSHQDHLYALLEMAKKSQVKNVFVHAITDGRDTPPDSGQDYIRALEQKIAEIGVGKIATISGRFYTMDRDKRWERIRESYEALRGSKDVLTAENPTQVFKRAYADQAEGGDEFLKPTVLVDGSASPVGPVHDGDGFIFFNFRADRAREITHTLTQKDFDGFEREVSWPHLVYVCMAPYEDSLNLPVAFQPHYPRRVLAEIIGEKGLKQLRIAETEKYAHVTFFFNGGVDRVYPGEDRILVPSPREVPTYDQRPEMSAGLVTARLMSALQEKKYDVIILNYANSDMVGHTAKPAAIVKAVETIDRCLGEVVGQVLAQGGEIIITADHGNAEQMVDQAGKPHTAHTTNLVPFILVSERFKARSLKSQGGRLCDVAPTMLALLNIPQPPEMSGESLLTCRSQ